MTTAHIDFQTDTINGVKFTNTHRGQKRAYGDSMYEYDIASDKAPAEVEAVCCEHIYKCGLPIEQWRKENREKPSMEAYFRGHYEFENRGDGRFFYRVTSPFTD